MSIPKMFKPTEHCRISLYFVEDQDLKNILKKIAVLNKKKPYYVVLPIKKWHKGTSINDVRF